MTWLMENQIYTFIIILVFIFIVIVYKYRHFEILNASTPECFDKFLSRRIISMWRDNCLQNFVTFVDTEHTKRARGR